MADNTAGTPAAPQGARQDNIQKDQQGGEIRRNNRNHRRRHSGQRQRPNDENRQRQGGEKGNKPQQPKERPEGRENKPQRDQNQKRKRTIDGQNTGRDQQFKREKRQRFVEDEREKEPVKKVETVDDIRSDNARITKEIYQVIASMKDITIE